MGNENKLLRLGMFASESLNKTKLKLKGGQRRRERIRGQCREETMQKMVTGRCFCYPGGIHPQ